MHKTKALLTIAFSILPLLLLAKAGLADVMDEDPDLSVMMLFMLIAFIAAIVAAVIVLLAIVAICCVLFLFGIASASAVTALYHRSLASGVTAFVYLLFISVGVGGAALAGWLLQRFFFPEMSLPLALLMSAVTGLLAGFIASRLVLYILRRAYRAIAQRLNR